MKFIKLQWHFVNFQQNIEIALYFIKISTNYTDHVTQGHYLASVTLNCKIQTTSKTNSIWLQLTPKACMYCNMTEFE